MTAIEKLLHRRSDLSTFIVHFTGGAEPTTARDSLLSIMRSRRLEARNTYGMAKELSSKFPEVEETQKVVCFTETPLEHAWMMCVEIDNRDFRFNGYGLAFTKTFARRRGANPVWYLDITPGHGVPGGRDWLTKAVASIVDAAEDAAFDPWDDAVDVAKLATSPILRLTPFIEQMGPTKTGTRKEFWWEREWRYVGNFSFGASDIVVAFAPEDEHSMLRTAIAGEHAYEDRMPTFVDANWGLERMIGALSGIPDLGPFPRG